MPKPRNPENRGLPNRWRKKPSGYYYQVPPGLESKWDGKKTFKLGTSRPEAYKNWADRLQTLEKVRTVNELLDRYALEILPTQAKASQTRSAACLKNIKAVFGEMGLEDIKPKHIYAYYDKRKKPTSARLEIALLSHAYTMAVAWGYLDKHPFKNEVRLKVTQPRTRYVEDWEILEALSLNCHHKKGGVNVIQAYIRIKLLTALRQRDMLRLKTSMFKDDGIHIQISKTKKPIIMEWSDELRKEIKNALALRPVDISPFLFCTRNGTGYIDEETGLSWGWQSMWQRFMTRLLKETKVAERFTEHDLRAKAASDSHSLERAKELLNHSNSSITKKVYRRKPEVIKPAK